MKRLMAGLMGLMLLCSVTGSAEAKTKVHLQRGATCGDYEGTDNVLIANIAGGQYVYVLWNEGNVYRQEQTSLADVQFYPTLPNGEPNYDFQLDTQLAANGWHQYQVPLLPAADYAFVFDAQASAAAYYARYHVWPAYYHVRMCFFHGPAGGALRQYQLQ